MKRIVPVVAILIIIGVMVALQQGILPRKYLSPKAAFAAYEPASIATIMQNKDAWHQKTVAISGKIFGYKEKVSRAGNPYTVFFLRENQYLVTVHYRGHLRLANNQEVTVEGEYLKVKHLGNDTFYDEVEAANVTVNQ